VFSTSAITTFEGLQTLKCPSEILLLTNCPSHENFKKCKKAEIFWKISEGVCHPQAEVKPVLV